MAAWRDRAKDLHVPVVEAYAIVIVLGVCIRRRADTSLVSTRLISIGMDFSLLVEVVVVLGVSSSSAVLCSLASSEMTSVLSVLLELFLAMLFRFLLLGWWEM